MGTLTSEDIVTSNLSPREEKVVRMVLGTKLDKDQELKPIEDLKIFKVTEERVKQIEEKVIKANVLPTLDLNTKKDPDWYKEYLLALAKLEVVEAKVNLAKSLLKYSDITQKAFNAIFNEHI